MKKNKSLFLVRLASTTLDLATIYSLAILLQALSLKFIFVKFSTLIIVVFLLYYFLSYVILSGRTPAKYLTEIEVVKNNEVRLPLISIIARELILKGFIGIIIPTYILEFFFPFWSAFLTMIILAVLLLLSSIAVFIFKNTWWEQLSKTQTIKTEKTSPIVIKYSFVFITLVFLSATSLIIYPFLKGKEDIKISLAPLYPVTKETKLYSDYIQKHAQNPVDYIFDLFNKYDLVVISERMHPEYTQYELIFKIINDPRFTNQVGNIFTECGSVSFQDTLRTYLHTHFENENSINKSTANLQRNSNGVWPLWDNTNLFDFFKTVNKLNRVQFMKVQKTTNTALQ